MFSQGDYVIAHAGVYGNLYKVNTISFAPYKKINFNLDKNATTFPYLNAINKIDDEVVVGTSVLSDAFPSKSTHGVWTLKPTNPVIRNTISTGNVGETSNLRIGAILPISSGANKSMLIGWQDGSSSGVDEIIGIIKYGSYQAFLETAFEVVGSRNQKTTYTELEVTLAKPLVANQSIRISYRKNLTDDYSVITTLSTANTSAGEISHVFPVGITDAIAVQTKIELSHDGIVSSSDNIQLKQIEIRK
jgi:hypothetical protein